MVTTTAITTYVLLPILAAIGSALSLRLVSLVNQGVAFLVHHVGVARLRKIDEIRKAHKGVIKDAIQFAQERYQDYQGKTKYDIVTEVAKKEFDRLGLPEVPEDQLEVLIHSMLKEVKGAFGQAWEDQVDGNNVQVSPVTDNTTLDA